MTITDEDRYSLANRLLELKTEMFKCGFLLSEQGHHEQGYQMQGAARMLDDWIPNVASPKDKKVSE